MLIAGCLQGWKLTYRNLQRSLHDAYHASISTRPPGLTRALTVDPGDAQELVSLQAGTTYQRAVDIRDTHQFGGVGSLYRAAVEENADVLVGFYEP